MGARASRLARAFRRGRALPRPTWWVAARVVPTVVTVRVLLTLLPYRVVARLFEPPPAAAYPLRGRRVRTTLLVADWAGRTFVADRPCLSQALAARWLLARDGFQTELHLGVRQGATGIEAHAWLEHDEQIVLGGSDSRARYVPLTRVRPEAIEAALAAR